MSVIDKSVVIFCHARSGSTYLLNVIRQAKDIEGQDFIFLNEPFIPKFKQSYDFKNYKTLII